MDAFQQHLRQANYQTFIWAHATQQYLPQMLFLYLLNVDASLTVDIEGVDVEKRTWCVLMPAAVTVNNALTESHMRMIQTLRTNSCSWMICQKLNRSRPMSM